MRTRVRNKSGDETRMSSRALATIVTLALLVAIALGLAAREKSRNHTFETLKPGLTKEAVVQQLGSPDFKTRESVGFFFNCATDSFAECWIYRSRIGKSYSVCFDKRERLACVGEYAVWV